MVLWCGLGVLVVRNSEQTWWPELLQTSSAILHRVSCSNEMIPNAPERYETLQNMSLGSYGVDRVQSFREIMKQLRNYE